MGCNIGFNKDKTKTKIFIYCILQKVLFEYIYVNIIYPPFRYYGFQADFDIFRYCLSWVMYLMIPLFTIHSYKKETLSNQAIAFLLNIVYTPCLILYAFHDSTPFIVSLILYYMTLVISDSFTGSIHFSIGNRNGIWKRNYDSLVLLLGLFLGIVIIFIWAYYTRFHLQISFFNVYETRLAAREYSMPKVFVYLRAMARGVMPLLAVYSVYKRKKLFCLWAVFVQYIQFCIDGTKTVLFTMALGLVAFYFADKYTHIVNRIPQVLSIGGALAIIENKLFHTSILSNFLFRRVMFVPALMNYQYYDLVRNNGLDYFRQSLGFLGKSRYSAAIARVIGEQYYSNSFTNANNGLFADAYVNLGVIGCVLMPIAIVIVFKLIEGAGRKLPKSVWTVCVIQLFFSFTSSSFFTVLITHGAVLMILVLYMLTPRQEDLAKES